MKDDFNLSAYQSIVEVITEGIYGAYPELLDKYGELGKKKCLEDNLHHFRYLEAAYAGDNQQIFTDYAVWLNHILTKRGMLADHLIDNFQRISCAINGKLEPDKERAFQLYLSAAIGLLEG